MLSIIAPLVLMLSGAVHAQYCRQDTAVLALVDPGQCREFTMLTDCFAQSVVRVVPTCEGIIEPGIRMSMDGTFCVSGVGNIRHGNMALMGPYKLGNKPMTFTVAGHPQGGMMMRVAGTYAPPQGGREFTLDCVMKFQVVQGMALGARPPQTADPGNGAGYTSQPGTTAAGAVPNTLMGNQAGMAAYNQLGGATGARRSGAGAASCQLWMMWAVLLAVLVMAAH